MAAHGIHSGLLSTGIGDKSHAAISPIWQLLLSSIPRPRTGSPHFFHAWKSGGATPVNHCCKGWGLILCAVDKPISLAACERRSGCIGGAGAMEGLSAAGFYFLLPE